MGEARKATIRLQFNPSMRLAFHGADITSDAGLLAYRELDNALGLTDIAEQCIQDSRNGKNTRHSLGAQLRQSVFSRLAGYEDTNDADRLAVDPAMRQIVGGRAIEHTASSTSQVSRFETEVLTTKENQAALAQLSGKWIDHVMKARKLTRIVLDMDSSVSETYGRQEGSAYNGHFGCTCYHPLFCFNHYGDLEGALLREGNVHSAKDWKSVLEPIVARYRDLKIARRFRGDAAFANPDIYEYLESESYGYAIRLPANDILWREIEHLLTRPVGRPSKAPIVHYHDFKYQAHGWSHPRRVIAKVEWHRGELFPRVGFIVTNLGMRAKNGVHFYNQRGTAEQWIKEGKNAVKWTRLSCHDFADNAVRLQLFALAYNFGNFLRQLALPKPIRNWSMTTLREKLIKIGAKVVRHARYTIFQLAEVAVPRELFSAIIARIEQIGEMVANTA
jgi:Transposase DDE domain group 1